MKPQLLPRHSPEAVAPTPYPKGASGTSRAFGPLSGPGYGMSGRERGLEPGAASLKLISSKTQSPESHPSEGEEACDTLGRPQADLAKPRAGPRQSALQLPASRGCQVATTLSLYGQNCPGKPGFGVGFVSILGPGVVSFLPSALIGSNISQAYQNPGCSLGVGWGTVGVSLSPQPQGGGDH